MQTILQLITGDGLRSRIVRGIGGTFALRIAFLVLSFIIRFVLARLLGASGLGVYSYALAWLDVLIVISVFGFNRLIVRETALYETRQDWGGIRGILRFTTRTTLMIALLASLVVIAVSAFTFQQQERLLSTVFFGLPISITADFTPIMTLWIALMILPIAAIVDLRQGVMQALHEVVRSQLPEYIVRPALILTFICAASLLGFHLSGMTAMGFNAAATGIAFLVGGYLYARVLPPSTRTAVPHIHAREWLAATLPLALIAGMSSMNGRIDQTLLGSILGADAVGVYSTASLFAQLVTTVMMAANMSLMPTIVRLHAAGEMRRLENIIQKTMRGVFAFTLVISMSMILLRQPLLSIFGEEFERAQIALVILVAGQLFNVATGPVGAILMMTRYERAAATNVGMSLFLNIVLNLLLIPRFGIEGAALSSASTLVVVNLLQVMIVRRRLGINPSIFYWRTK